MIRSLSVASIVSLTLLGGPALAATPFPPGYEAAYSNYLSALPAAARQSKWLSKLEGVASQPQPLQMGGQSLVYLFACKAHNCDTDNTNIFLMPDRKSFKAVVKINGARTLLGGAGPKEVACVAKLDASGGVANAC